MVSESSVLFWTHARLATSADDVGDDDVDDVSAVSVKLHNHVNRSNKFCEITPVTRPESRLQMNINELVCDMINLFCIWKRRQST